MLGRGTAVALCLALLLALSAVPPVRATWFSLAEGKERCFLEEVPKDTLVVAKFKALLNQGNQWGGESPLANVPVAVIAYDPEGNEVLRREMQSQGRFALTSQSGGEYRICLSTTKSGWFSGQELKFYLSIDSGVGATDYGEIAKRDHLTSLEVQVRQLNDRIRDVRAEQNYQRAREARFRDTSESTNSRVAWWSVIQTSILVGTGLWQITHLKSFFKEKKLV